MKDTTKGWVVLSADGTTIYDFTFKRTRSESIRRWCSLWGTPKNWRGHYRKGHRCVKAIQTITAEPTVI